MISVKSDQKPLIVKWLIGCSVLFGIVILFLVGALFWLNQQSENISQYPKEYAHLYQNDDFVPPPNNIISEKDLQTYIEINQKLRAEVQRLTGKMQFSFELSPDQTPEEMIKQMRTIRNLQVRALKEVNFSLKKYKWITRQIVVCYGGELAKKMNLMLRVFRTGEELDIQRELENIHQHHLDLFDKYHQEIDQMRDILLLGI
ncbi:hypothetical protein DRP98_03500 [candidate division KSB1 bacterium]|nr:MAG: hypothetical protein DRP98_03500 [candidate division KSB1 bacterium]